MYSQTLAAISIFKYVNIPFVIQVHTSTSPTGVYVYSNSIAYCRVYLIGALRIRYEYGSTVIMMDLYI